MIDLSTAWRPFEVSRETANAAERELEEMNFCNRHADCAAVDAAARASRRFDDHHAHGGPILVGQPRPSCTDNSPSWFTGRWRDWHRGHGCDKDDGKPRTPEGAAEVQRGGR